MARARNLLVGVGFVALGCMSLLSGACFATPVFEHGQTTLGTELVASIPNPGAAQTVETFEFDITNLTNSDWTDYHFVFFNPLGSVSSRPNELSIGNVNLLTTPFADFLPVIDNAHAGPNGELAAFLTLVGGLIRPGDTFKVELQLTYSNSVSVRGTPSVSEPSTIPMILAGVLLLILFAPSSRRH